MKAYAQSKLAIILWSQALATKIGQSGPAIIEVNPGSMLGSKMVKEGFGVTGGDLRIGADILIRASLSDEFADATGKYFDNDSKKFSAPHPDALDIDKVEQFIQALNILIKNKQTIFHSL
jgi:NAD(P)-dependent dehydrogenase (short-subunit alcohol dehydrogenase family)